MKFLSDLYNITLKKGIRGKASEGFVRPTIGQNFMTDRDFEEIISTIWDTFPDPGDLPYTKLSDNSIKFREASTFATKTAKDSGKYYVEMSTDEQFSLLGVAPAGFNYLAHIGQISGAIGVYLVEGWVMWGPNNSRSTLWPPINTGSRISLAINLDDKKIKFTYNGGTYSPEYTLTDSPIHLAVSCGSGSKYPTQVVYTDPEDHLFSPPDGYLAGWPEN